MKPKTEYNQIFSDVINDGKHETPEELLIENEEFFLNATDEHAIDWLE